MLHLDRIVLRRKTSSGSKARAKGLDFRPSSRCKKILSQLLWVRLSLVKLGHGGVRKKRLFNIKHHLGTFSSIYGIGIGTDYAFLVMPVMVKLCQYILAFS